jgi:hypothetical protein
MAAIERQEREARLGDALGARMAQADKKGWKDYIKRLTGGA